MNKFAVVGYHPDYDSDTEKEFVAREVFSTWETKPLAEQAKAELIEEFGSEAFWYSFGLFIEPHEEK